MEVTKNFKNEASRGVKGFFIFLFVLAFLAAAGYWFYMLYELEKLSNESELETLFNAGVIARDTMKQNAAFQGMVVSGIVIFFIASYL